MLRTSPLRSLRSSSTLLSLLAIAIASGAVLIQQREYQQDIAAHEFLDRATQTTHNSSAAQLNEQLQQLGLGRTDGQPASTPAALTNDASTPQFQEIEQSLSQYLREQRQVKHQRDALTPLPPAIANYLSTQQTQLLSAQQFILESPLPVWELQVATLTGASQQTTTFFPVAGLQRLLLAQGISVYDDEPQSAAESFEAAWRLTEAIAARPDLLSQMLSGILQQQQATLLRYIALPREQWQARLSQDQQQSMLQAITFDQWNEYQTLQQRTRSTAATSPEPAWRGLLDKQYLQFSQLDWLAARKRNHSQLAQQQLCQLDTAAEQFPVTPHRLNAFGQSGVTLFAQEWIKAGDRMLSAELTQKVIQAKQLAHAEGQWPQQLIQLESQVCPGVAWNYERRTDGSMALWFGQSAHWRVGISGDFAPLSYEADAVQADTLQADAVISDKGL